MNQRVVEALVGVFMVLGMAALVFLAFRVSGLTLSGTADAYRVYAEFTDIAGLSVRGKVSMAGVTVGRVSSITLNPDNYKAVVQMDIDNEVSNISTDSVAVIRTAGLLGEKYVDIAVGADESFMKDGSYFIETQSSLNLEKLIGNFATGK